MKYKHIKTCEMTSKKTNRRAFTLIEMLIVVVVIAILSGIVILAISPARQMAHARNAQRTSDLRAIHSAVQQYYIDNLAWPGGLTAGGQLQEICDEFEQPTDCINLNSLVPIYLSAIPKDPQAVEGTKYEIAISLNSPNSENPVLTAPNSVTDNNMYPVEIGTTTLASGSGSTPEPPEPCGDPTNVDCWSEEATGLSWGPGGTTDVKSTINGLSNTQALVALSETYPAAQHCHDLTEGNVPAGTWYLPASEELFSAWQDLGPEVFASDYYWSSTETIDISEDFSSRLFTQWGGSISNGFKSDSMSVRCLR